MTTPPLVSSPPGTPKEGSSIATATATTTPTTTTTTTTTTASSCDLSIPLISSDSSKRRKMTPPTSGTTRNHHFFQHRGENEQQQQQLQLQLQPQLQPQQEHLLQPFPSFPSFSSSSLDIAAINNHFQQQHNKSATPQVLPRRRTESFDYYSCSATATTTSASLLTNPSMMRPRFYSVDAHDHMFFVEDEEEDNEKEEQFVPLKDGHPKAFLNDGQETDTFATFASPTTSTFGTSASYNHLQDAFAGVDYDDENENENEDPNGSGNAAGEPNLAEEVEGSNPHADDGEEGIIGNSSSSSSVVDQDSNEELPPQIGMALEDSDSPELEGKQSCMDGLSHPLVELTSTMRRCSSMLTTG